MENKVIAALSSEDQQLVEQFLSDNQLFYGPDPQIMRSHALAARSAQEERILAAGLDAHRINIVRGRTQSALDETHTMIEQMGVAPGAQWGDLVTAIFTASGDLSMTGTLGVVVFASVCQYPVKFISKYWTDDETVGVRDGDAFIHNDSRYGNIHNTDQSLIMPVFWEGNLVCWVSATIHEGENGAIEPGGMPSIAESKFDEGLKMCPFKVVENFRLRRDLVNFLQNSVRDPKLQMADMKVKLHTVIRLRERVLSVIAEHGVDLFVGTLRKTLEDTEAEVRRRIGELPDGTVRANTFIDGTLREHVLAKMPMEVTVSGERMIWNFRGASPEFTNRSVNTVLGSFKTCLATSLLIYIWPDLPKNQAVFSAVEVETDENSLVNASVDAPNAMSLIPLFRTFTIAPLTMAKLLYCLPKRYTAINANTYNQPATFVYGGLTQHHEITGNFCADINGNGTGAREHKDGEHSLSPVFGYMADTGEMELAEENLPYVRLVAQKLARDRTGFGKYRGGMGYEQISTVRDSPEFGFMTGQCGGKHPSAYPLFGGYACPAYPLAKIKNINIFEVLQTAPEQFDFDMITLMNERKIPGGSYIVQDAGMNFEACAEGEIYMICQGAGGGYGDVLERDPALVMKDVEEGLLSPGLAAQLYRVAFNPDNLVVDPEATRELRDRERRARIDRGVPYDEFVERWVRDGPSEDINYMGSWGEDNSTLVVSPPGGTRYSIPAGSAGVMLSNPKDRRIAALESEISTLKAQLARET
jgi:N-methylhydantoinase B/oxoprolinase/acetone carboxylase alpha subunit